jgi:nitrite reductase/ring-hydroxylating ferredoxin subunit
MSPGTPHVLASLEDVPHGTARGFAIELGGRRQRFVAVHLEGSVRVYRNRCPHRGTPLDWVPDHFLDSDGAHLVCATHGAIFRPADGFCIAGPCAGDALSAVPARVEAGRILVELAAD